MGRKGLMEIILYIITNIILGIIANYIYDKLRDE